MTPARSDTFAGTKWPGGNTITLQANKRYFMELTHYDPSWAGGDDFAALVTDRLDACICLTHNRTSFSLIEMASQHKVTGDGAPMHLK